jgi:hypothetical protein
MDVKPFADPDLEETFLSAVAQGHESAKSVLSIVKPEHFDTPTYRWFLEVIKQRSDSVPTKGMLIQIVDDTFKVKDEQDKYKLSLSRLYSLNIEQGASDAVLTYKRFISLQQTSTAIKRFYDDYGRTRKLEFALRDLELGLADAKEALSTKQLQVVDFAKTFKEREAVRKYKRDNPDLFPRMRFGIPKLDAQLKCEFGTVTQFLAPMKRYKSVILATGAFASVLQGFNTVLVVVENSIELTMNRLDSMFTSINYDRVVNYLKDSQERKHVDQLFEKIDKWPQRLKVIKGNPNELTIPDLDRELRRLEREEGFTAEVKIIDYLNLMKASTAVQRDNDEQTEICWDMQKSAKDPSRPSIFITASQANMAGAEIDKDGKPVKVRQHHQGRSIGIAQAVDNSIGIDVEYTKGQDGSAAPPNIILSPLFFRDGSIMYPEVRLVSEIDRMCIDRSINKLWEEAEW